MKKHILYAGIISQLFLTEQLLSQTDTVKTVTTTTTTKNDETDDNAYSNELPRVYIGARYMPTFTRFNVRTVDNGVAETSFTMGYGAGGYWGFNLSKNMAFQAEVVYSQLSQQYRDQNLKRRIDLDYLYVPLLIVLNTDITKSVNLNVTAGPQFGINMGSNIDSGGGSGSDTLTAVIAVKATDFGIAYGAGLDFRLSSVVSVDLGFRGMKGLVDISDESATTATDQYYILHRSRVSTYAAYVGLKLSF